ncbi:putative Beta-1,4-mannosyltransferase [Taphrina deformans PYCC 5710]|uniref:Chitobiosyldiphosphodolichol beta-mannosyltransferase n=1 Tax=Taphrina deformans (strain PYCC 5710 / ATCC 11124 / CBS 356.35 / IMI 108563 / JCM 9778 / NBRC 8474) TaxID=1097556 RepID=R4XEC7_TAPDE|nr:putative Beta-1,4-mannosyltransferase [Taphrina deformans PYCC 5710]|eukprot:CCG82826.1 putative Beta-1,4-mannosyltransferase [Taphrina deformans PYCC 5710]
MIYYLLGACILYIVTLAYFFTPSPYLEGSKFAKKNQTIAILVLGDIGRSPRMLYHAGSLSRAGFKVQIIGYKGTMPHQDVLNDANIQYQFVPQLPTALNNQPKWLFPILGPVKVLHQIFFLCIILGYAIDPPAYILLQNPPSIPVLALGRLFAWIRNSRLVIDWHNLGYSILGLKLGAGHPMVSISKVYEKIVGRNAYAHLAVTDSMSTFLRDEVRASGSIKTLHDRPPAQFRVFETQERVQFLFSCDATQGFEPARDKLVVSSTSWTLDEDFQILLDALVAYDSDVAEKPRLLVVITGKGPLLGHYRNLIAGLALKSVTIRCCWLRAEDYPKILASADLGISLHSSSSGLDLPMKVVDMFGCGLPVLALRFACIHELVIEGLNGRTFSDSEDLSQCLLGLFAEAEGKEHLRVLREGAIEEGKRRWDGEWSSVASTIFQKR